MAKTFSEQSEIDDRAKRIARERLEDSWTVRDRIPDIHVDYEIEHKHAGEPTALTAYVQLKGTKKLNVSGRVARLSLKTKHLKYWAKARRPVMLILVETSNKRCYFLFIQAWLIANRLEQELGKQNNLRVRVPLENDLSPEHFLQAVKDADLYLRDLHPSSPKAAIMVAEQAWSKLDPRFNVAMTATKSNQTYSIIPCAGEPVSLELTLSDLSADQMLSAKSTFDWGRPCKLTTEKIRIEGSPLFEKISQNAHWAELGVQGKRIAASVRLIAGARSSQQFAVNGFLSAGAAGIAFTADEDSPIRVNLEFPTNDRSSGLVSINFQADPDAWHGSRLLSLTRLDEVARFAKAAARLDSVRFELWAGSFRMLKPRRRFKSKDLFDAVAWWFGLLRESVDAAVYFGIDPIVPKMGALSDAQINKTWQAIRIAKRGGQEINHYDVEPNENAKAVFADGRCEASGFVQIAIPLMIDVLACENQAGFLQLEPVPGRLVKTTGANGDEVVRVFPTDAESFSLRHVVSIDAMPDSNGRNG